MEHRGQFDEDLASLSVNETMAVASITVAELLIGAELGRTAELRYRARASTEELLRHVPALPFDLEAARIFAYLTAELQAAGLRVGGFDLQIAAIAIAHGHSVVTLNLREFNRIPGLEVIAPEW